MKTKYEGYRGKFSSDTKLACLLSPFSAIGLYPFAYRSQENIKNFCCPIRVSLTRGSPAKRRELKHRSPIKKKSPKKNAPTETTMSDSSNSTCVLACVAWRFCRAGRRSGVAAKFAREARENERRSREKNKNRLP